MPNEINKLEKREFLNALKQVKQSLKAIEKNVDVKAHLDVIQKIEECQNVAEMFNNLEAGYGGQPMFLVADNGQKSTGVAVMVEKNGQFTINDVVGLPRHGAGKD